MPVPSITSEMASNLPWLRSILNDPLRKGKKLNDALRRWGKKIDAGVWMLGLCKCKIVLWYEEMFWLHLKPFKRSVDEYGELQLRQCSPNVFGWAVWLWRIGCDCSASWQRPWGLLAGVFSWQNEKRRHNEDRPSHPALSRLLCHFSQTASTLFCCFP